MIEVSISQMRIARLWFTFLIVTSLVVGVTGSGIAAPGSNDLYALGPGDTIEIVVLGDPDLSRTITIKPDGIIALPLIGEVTAAGRTTSQLSAQLVKLYLKYLKAPSITVTVREFGGRIFVLGQVNKPGEYPIRSSAGVFELLASAGGPTTRADLAKATIIRGKTETIQVNLLEALAKNTSPDVKLQPGDVLYLPETDPRVHVLGQVNRPGAYDPVKGWRVSDLLSHGGGVTPKAGLQKAFIMRGSEQIPVDLKKVLAGDPEANIALEPRDMLVVPESQDRIAILGGVAHPGVFDFTDGMRLLEAIALAGGFTEGASPSQVEIIRLEAGKTTKLAANVSQALSGDMRQNIMLRSGDVVVVPQNTWTVGALGTLADIVRVIFGFWR